LIRPMTRRKRYASREKDEYSVPKRQRLFITQ